MKSILLNNVTKSFGHHEVIKPINLEINAGEFVVFVGPSGCGKSTLLRMISGLENVSSGQMIIGDKDVTHLPPKDREVAMVFQSYALYPHMSVGENIAFGLKIAGIRKDERMKIAMDAAKILQLDQLFDRKPKELSGGQRQRVAIGRAIVKKPSIFLFDEPLSNLDAELRVQMRQEINKLHQDVKATMIYVTHDQVEAMTMADKIVVLRGGVVEQVGTPMELYENPVNEFVAGFIGSPKMNLLSAEVMAIGDHTSTIRLDNFSDAKLEVNSISVKGKVGDKVKIGVRPQHIKLSDNGAFTAPLSTSEALGNVTYNYLDIGASLPLCVESHIQSKLKSGNVTFDIDSSQVKIFNQDGLIW